jgi:hypothetical protein
MFDAYVAVAIAPQYENFHTTTFEWARVRPGWNIFMYSFLSLISDMWLLYEEFAVHVLIPNLVEKADLLFYYELCHFDIIEHDYNTPKRKNF